MTMHQGGEVDVRGCYCALAACHMLGMDSTVEAVAQACSLERFVADCQSHEGGIGGEPWNEAHGGYTFCGFASLMLAGRAHAIDVELLERWGVRMQGWMEGGFMGRTNKLVDGCYSLWQGGIFPILRRLYREQGRKPRGAPQSLAKDEAAVERLQVAAEAVRQEWSGGMNAVIEAILATEVLPPEAAAQAGVLRAQAALDAAVEQCVAAETELRAAVGAEDESAIAQKKATAAATLEAASNAQEALERAEAHAQSAVHAACSIVASREPLLGADGLAYDARALQVWLLVCCQMAKGGLRDKPGKGADYYHTCYCLSGLSSAQHASGLSLGGERNRLAAADPLCNVEETRLAEAREYFLNATVDSGTATQDT